MFMFLTDEINLISDIGVCCLNKRDFRTGPKEIQA